MRRSTTMRMGILSGVIACLGLTTGCGKRSGEDESGKYKAQLEAEIKQHQSCQETVRKLRERVAKLELATKKLAEQPCAYELDPVTLEVKVRPGVQVHQSRPAEGPPINLKQVKAKLLTARRTLKTCYEEAARRDKSLQDPRTVTLKFTIYNSGKVGNIKLVPYVGGGFVPCVKRVIGSWRFERFGGFPKNFKLKIHLTPK